MRTCVQIHVKLGMVAYIYNVSSPSVGWEEEREEPFTSLGPSILVYVVMNNKVKATSTQTSWHIHAQIHRHEHTHTHRGGIYYFFNSVKKTLGITFSGS